MTRIFNNKRKFPSKISLFNQIKDIQLVRENFHPPTLSHFLTIKNEKEKSSKVISLGKQKKSGVKVKTITKKGTREIKKIMTRRRSCRVEERKKNVMIY